MGTGPTMNLAAELCEKGKILGGTVLIRYCCALFYIPHLTYRLSLLQSLLFYQEASTRLYFRWELFNS